MAHAELERERGKGKGREREREGRDNIISASSGLNIHITDVEIWADGQMGSIVLYYYWR